jgi:hypothetical protein
MLINVDGNRISIEQFLASKGLQVQGSLDLRGTDITALPDGLSVGGSLDLSDCPNIKNVFRAGKDRRGYEFFGVRLANGWRVISGCRNFSPAEAREHWANNRECLALAERVIAAETAALKAAS